MANINEKVSTNSIGTDFITKVANTILANTVDINSIPRDGFYQCIPSSVLGNKSTLNLTPPIYPDTIISADKLYSALISVTETLTCVGTYVYLRYFGDEVVYSIAGKALFNSSYARKITTAENSISANTVISASTINQLFANLLTAWNKTSKYNNVSIIRECHNDCHTDCHSDCHSDCNCYK